MIIYKQLLNVQNKLKAPKGQFNNFGKYKYRSCEDILEAVKPVCFEEGITPLLSDKIELIGDRYYIVATLTIFNDTESISVTAYAREEDSKKGMDGSQITGASSSYARKYALNGMFCIDDSVDSDKTNTHGKGKKDEAETFILTDDVIVKMYNIAATAGIGQEQVFADIQEHFTKETPDLLTKKEYDRLCLYYSKKAKLNGNK